MGAVYRDKKSCGCALCKPWKHGWSKKFTDKEIQFRKWLDAQVVESAIDMVEEENFRNARLADR